ncbi:MAG: hypothetical protein ACYS0I_04040 [Planctomycetota bacterium]|jgi:hypothetical protein
MEEKQQRLEDEIDDLRQELEHFQEEKERVRQIIGKIGGVPKLRTKLINAIFIVVIVGSIAVSVVGGQNLRLLMIEVATVALSLKIIYLLHCQARVTHFEFWVLSSLEWRLIEMMKQLKKSENED